jgi:hypothetical protein
VFADLPPAVPERCAVTASARRSDVAAGFTRRNALGPGPVFPITRLLVRGAEPVVDGGKPIRGRYVLKVLWTVAPRYRAAVTISGTRLDGPGDVRFANEGRAGRPRGTIRIARQRTAAWRERPSNPTVPAPGCYALVLRGTGLDTAIVVRIAASR